MTPNNNDKKKANKPLSDDAIILKISGPLQRAIDNSEEISDKHADGYKLYRRAPYAGDDKLTGTSQYVSGEAHNAVQWMAAQLVKIYLSQKRVVEFLPRGPEDQPLADQQTDVVNYLVTEANSYGMILNQWMKEGLIAGLGICTAELSTGNAGWTPKRVMTVTDDQLPAIVAQEQAGELRIVATGEPQMIPPAQPGMPPITSRQLEVRFKRAQDRLTISSIPVDRFIVSRDAEFDQQTGGIKAHLQGYWRNVPRFELTDLGYDAAKVASIASAEEDDSDLTAERTREIGGEDGTGDVHDEVRVSEVFMRLDADNDGYAELLRFTIGGEIGKKAVLLGTQEVSLAPFAAFVPESMPHTIIGNGIPHQIEPEMRLATQAKRAIIDNLNMSNFPTRIVMDGAVNLDDLLNPAADKIIRVTDSNAITYQAPPFLAGQSYQFVSLLDEAIEQTTGVGRNLQGVVAPDMQNETATGAMQRASASQMLIEQIAKQFSETGYRYLFKIITSLLADNPEAAGKITTRIRGQMVPVQSDGWNPDLDLRSNIGFGVATKDVKAAALMMIGQSQAQFMGSPMVDPGKQYNVAADLAENAGLHPERYFNDPANIPPAPPAPPPENPEMVKAQAEMQMAQQKFQFEQQIQMEKLKGEQMLAQQKLQAEIELARWKAEQEMTLKGQELQAEAQLTILRNQAPDNIRAPF